MFALKQLISFAVFSALEIFASTQACVSPGQRHLRYSVISTCSAPGPQLPTHWQAHRQQQRRHRCHILRGFLLLHVCVPTASLPGSGWPGLYNRRRHTVQRLLQCDRRYCLHHGDDSPWGLALTFRARPARSSTKIRKVTGCRGYEVFLCYNRNRTMSILVHDESPS